MFSPLPPGTRQARTYNQAARNIACMAEGIAQAGLSLASFENLAFVVLPPRSQLTLPDFAHIMQRDSVARVVAERVSAYEGFHVRNHVGAT